MRLVSYCDLATGEHRFTLTITENDLISAQFEKFDKSQIDYFNRENATIEERLMGLQLIVRRVEGVIKMYTVTIFRNDESVDERDFESDKWSDIERWIVYYGYNLPEYSARIRFV